MHALKTLLAAAAVFLPSLASAASLNGAELSIVWAIPFAGILLSIALIPLAAPHLWHHHYGKIAAAWGLACVIPIFMAFPTDVAVGSVAHAMIGDYVPFILFVGALFIVAGGIHIRSSFGAIPRSTPAFFWWALSLPTSWARRARPCSCLLYTSPSPRD